MRVSCLVCGGTFEPSPITGLLRCRSCSFTTANLELSDDELGELYSSDYFSGREYMDYLTERELLQSHFRSRLSRLLEHLSEPETKHLFEIGAAYGFFLEVARPVFASVRGIDISAEASRHAREQLNLPVETGDFLATRISVPVDVLCMWDTIEHLVHPDRYIEKAADVMRRNAVICITTGDIGSLMARWRGGKWRQIHPPTHLHYFSAATLSKLLERHGFRVEHLSHPGMWRSVDTMAHIVFNLRHRQRRVYELLRRLGLLNWHAYLNLGDIMFVIAKRH